MKTLLLKWGCLLIALSACFIGCTKDNNDEVDSLVGIWKGLSIRGYDKDKATGVISGEQEQDLSNDRSEAIFNKDHSYEFQVAYYTSRQLGTWEREGNKVIMHIDKETDGSTVVEVKIDSESEIKELSANSLTLLGVMDEDTFYHYIEITYKRIK